MKKHNALTLYEDQWIVAGIYDATSNLAGLKL